MTLLFRSHQGSRARRTSHRRLRPVVESCETRLLLSGGTITYTSSPAGEDVTFIYKGVSGFAIAGDQEVSIDGAPVRTVVYCVDLDATIGGGATYNVQVSTTASVPNGGKIAYLVNKEAASISAQLLASPPSPTAADESAGLQLAIWSLEYGSNFKVNSAPAGALSYEAQYLAEANGHSATATFLQPTDPDDGQGFVIPGQNYTQGFWKNHPDAWPAPGLTIAGASFTESTLIDLLNTPPKQGDASLILVHQLIAAELNIINGVYPTPDVVNAINEANQLLTPVLTGGVPTGFTYVSSSSATGQQMVALAGVLDSFNSMNGG